MTPELNPDETAFVQEIGRRITPEMGTVLQTKRGKIAVSPTDHARLELISRREGLPTPAHLVSLYQTD